MLVNVVAIGLNRLHNDLLVNASHSVLSWYWDRPSSLGCIDTGPQDYKWR